MVGSQRHDLFRTEELHTIDFLQCHAGDSDEYSLIGSSKHKLAIKSELLEEGQREAIRKEHLKAVEKRSQRTIKTLNSNEDSNKIKGNEGESRAFSANNLSSSKQERRKLSYPNDTKRGETKELPEATSSASVTKRATGNTATTAKGTVKRRLERVISKIHK